MDKKVLTFLNESKLISISTLDNEGGVWAFNAYFGNTEKEIFFVSQKDTKHIEYLKNNPNIAFTVSWYNNDDTDEIIGVQGKGKCEVVKNPKDIITGVQSICSKFPEWKEWITPAKVTKNLIDSRLFKIDIQYIKYRNSKELGDEGVIEYLISK